MENAYVLGNLVKVRATFTDEETGELVDPDTVTYSVRAPDGTVTAYTTPDVVHDSEGKYHLDVSADASGEWKYRIVSTGTGQAAIEGKFTVPKSPF